MVISIACTPTPLGVGGLSDFSESLYRRELGQTGILGGNWHFRWGGFFFRRDLKTSCIKNSECKSQAKKKKKIQIVISTISHLVPSPNKFVVVCICIIIFLGLYSPQDFLLWGANFFFVSCS